MADMASSANLGSGMFRSVVNLALKHTLLPLAILSFIYCLRRSFQANLVSNSVKIILYLVLGSVILSKVNSWLNDWATNNWRVSANEGWIWDHEVAVVTGGSGDIGQALVEGLVSKGVQVAVLDVQEPPRRLINDEKVIYIRCDVSVPSEIAAAQDVIKHTFGHPSLLINNAGIVRTTTILDEPEDHLRRIVGVNLMAHWFTAKVFLPHMLSQNKGHIVTVASLAAFVALPTSVDYSATKAGALAFHEGLTCEIKHLYKAPGVMTTIVLPDFVKTRMTEPYWTEVENAGGVLLEVDEVVEPILRQIFSRRGGQIFVPKSRAVVSFIRGWPNWLQEIVRDVIGRKDRAVDSPWIRR